MTIVRSLAGWIAFAIAGSFAAERWACLVAFIVAALSLGLALRAHRQLSIAVIELSTTTFFALATIVFFVLDDFSPGIWLKVASQLWLAGTVALTLAIHRPFTLAIARTQAPERVWHTPEFYAFNVVITRAWMISFTCAAILLAGLGVLGVTSTGLSVAVIIAAIVVPVLFTNFRKRGLAERMQAAA